MLRIFFILLFCLSLQTLTACAVPPQADSGKIAATLKKDYPQLQFSEINPTPVNGIYEVLVKNGELIYFAPESGHMFFGELWTADARNLTQESKDRRLSAKVDQFPLDKAIKIGQGPIQVIEVTDPDCPFCRKSSAFFADRDDVTRYVFLFPLTRIHPQAEAKARYILSSPDPGKAYEDVFSGQYDQQPVPKVTDNGVLALHQKIAEELGINGTPRFWIQGQHIAGYNPKRFEEMLKAVK